MNAEIDDIKKAIASYFKDKPVKKAWLFGSYARNEANGMSDVDVLVDFEENSRVGLRYLVWHEEIESIVKKKVQVVSNKALPDYIRPFVEADRVLFYEK